MTASVYSQSSNSFSHIARIGCLALLALYSAPLWSFDFAENMQFHGFASQGYSLTSENNFFGRSQNNGSFDYTEIGANASWLLLNHLQLSGQLLFRRAGESDSSNLRLDYCLLDYSLFSSDKSIFGFRLGRIKTPWGLYNETRDVAFTRPSVLLPQSIYFDRVRSFVLSGDGAALYGEWRTDWGDFFFQGNLIRTQVDNNVEEVFFSTNWPGHTQGALSNLNRILYDWQGGQIRLGFSFGQMNIDYESSSQPGDLSDGSAKLIPLLFSAQYNAESWSLTSEYYPAWLRYRNFDEVMPNDTTRGEGFYLQGIYRFAPNWEFVLRHDFFYFDKDDKNGKKFEQQNPGFPGYSRFFKDWTTGLNWNISNQFTIRSEFHWINGTAMLSLNNNPNPADTSQHWKLLLLLASYRF